MSGKSAYLSSYSRKIKGKFAADWIIWPFYSPSERNCCRQVWFSRSWEKLYAFGPDVTSSIVGTWVYKKMPGAIGVFSPAPGPGTRSRFVPKVFFHHYSWSTSRVNGNLSTWSESSNKQATFSDITEITREILKISLKFPKTALFSGFASRQWFKNVLDD